MYSKVFSFFTSILEANPDTCQAVEHSEACIYFERGDLVFSLEGLHQFLVGSSGITYQAFRKMLYASTLNQDLAELGGKVVVFRSGSKVDTSLYCLSSVDR